jgi:SWIM zinc finger
MALNSIAPMPTVAQYASAALHLDRRSSWRTVRLDGTRYVIVTSGSSGHVYWVRADAAGCSCAWYLRTGRQCSHMLALELEALEAELEAQQFESWLSDALGPPQAPVKASYEDLFPACRDCGDLSETRDGYCDRCASDREWEARRDAQYERYATQTEEE